MPKAEWEIWKLEEIKYPKNSQRTITGWATIGYKPRDDETPIGCVRVKKYKTYHPLWSDAQVVPMRGEVARKRREEYHAYLFRLRVWNKYKDKIRRLNSESPGDALIFVVELMEDTTLWALESLVAITQKQSDFDVWVVTDALKDTAPIAPVILKKS